MLIAFAKKLYICQTYVFSALVIEEVQDENPYKLAILIEVRFLKNSNIIQNTFQSKFPPIL